MRFFTYSLLVLSLLLGGCLGDSDEASVETQEKQYVRGQQLLKEGRHDEALVAFLKVADKRMSAPESHLEAGRIYLEQIKDPVAAIYHFRKFLEVKPESAEAPMVTQMVESAKKAFAGQLPGNPYEDSFQRLDLLQLIENLRKENSLLKQEIANLKGRLEAGGAQLAPARTSTVVLAAPQNSNAPQAPAPQQYSLYTVTSGDTLSSISHKVYGSSAKWKLIFEANKDKLRNAHDLKIGQKLRVPQL